MKKIIVMLALVAVACAPAMAGVANVKVGYQKSSNTVTVMYCTDGNSVRAFALDLSVSTGTITGVTCSNTSYYIYPGSIQITGGSVCSTCYGSCVCSTSYPGTKGGVGTTGVTVEMGSLYTGTNKPASSGTLLTFGISNTAATVTIAAEPVRGGIVMERAEEIPSVTIASGVPDCAPNVDCFPSTYTTYTDWKTMGKPNCWCGTNGTPVWKFQCYGDGDNSTEGSLKYRVYNNDYWKMKSNWKKKITTVGLDPCADFDHKGEGSLKYRVYNNDYWRMKSNWKKKDSQLPGSGNCPIAE